MNNIGKTAESALSPSRLNNLARSTIENNLGTLWVTGEVTDYYLAPSGHAYFSLKDTQSSIKCTFFRQYNFKKTIIKNGDNLLALGQATLYEERGTFQLKVERVETSGIGDMAKAFAELKVKLEGLGYFKSESKQKIPQVINSLAIVTSQTSAAVKDVLNVIKRRNPLLHVTIYHASVQGEAAIGEIIDALLSADINQHDVILLTRGGGSQEDLWTFNDVSVAQTLFNINTPCVSAIGHERDNSITDLVADACSITPTAAAEMLTPDIENNILKLKHNLATMQKIVRNKLSSQTQQLDIAFHKLQKSHPKNQITKEKQQLDNKISTLKHAIKSTIQAQIQRHSKLENNLIHFNFEINSKNTYLTYTQNNLYNLISIKQEKHLSEIRNLSNSLNTLSPLATLSRGYSITLKQDNGEVITDNKHVQVGDVIETKLKKGMVVSRVVE